MNEKRLFNDGWHFTKTNLDVASSQGLIFEPVSIPHDWLIYNTENLYENSIGWYRKEYVNTENNQNILLCFDGVYMDSYLYVNGRLIGTWKYGYSSFEYDITHALHEGLNEILLKVVYQSPNSRWYSGAGIYRNVWLKTRASSHIVTDGIYISTKQSDDGWQVELDTSLSINANVKLSHTIRFGDDVITSTSQMINPNNNNVHMNRQHLYVKSPHLWSPDSPSLYQLYTVIEDVSGNPIEFMVNNFGFMSIRLDSDQGLFINGERLKLYGVCEHHDLGALGAAFNKTAMIRRLKLLKEMGVNAIRTAHNMPAPELMDLADEMGFLIISEAFDMWERPKTTFDYARFFNDYVERDVKSWVMRDRNHPSLFLWSIGNEIYDTHADKERGMELTKRLKNLVSLYDPKENAAVTFGSNFIPWENTQKCADLLKVVGYNYAARYYNDHHIKYPDWVIYGSETCSTVQSRGIYHFPFEQSLMADDDEQCSSLGNSSTSWGAASTEDCIISDRDTPFSFGQFIWTGFDYIGEPTPYHTKNSYFGQLDTATFKKDSFYIYQAEWTDYRKSPMIHIFPYWDFSMGQHIDVRVCSNAPVIELFLNGVSKGKHFIDHINGKELVGTWKLAYEPGELKALAYGENGTIIAADIKSSYGDATSIKLHADKSTMLGDGQDIIFLEISMEDKDGNPVDNANNRVHVNVNGAGSLIGLDNGDSTDYDQYKGKSRRLFSGKLMALIGSIGVPGKVTVEVSSKGMETIYTEFESIATDRPIGTSSFTGNSDLPILTGNSDEIPLRKIEIVLDKEKNTDNILDKKRQEILARAVLHPANTSYKDVEWTIVNAAGIPINNAKIEGSGLYVKVIAMADGEFYLRCTSSNGTNKTKLISRLEFRAKEIGTFYKNPYEFISAGLYDYSKGAVGNGNEKGIATMYDTETIVGYKDIDFGSYGSNKITIPIFALNDEAYPIQIWEGMPGEVGSSLLTEVVYQKPSIWNVYQDDTYILPRRLKGVTSISLVLQNKVHIKGFSFKKINRAFEQNYANASDNIYGDDYKVLDDGLLHVGNNISLEYNDMDFSEEGTTKLSIHGKSYIDKNSIIILSENQKEKSRQLVSFTNSEVPTTQKFEIKKIKGTHKITLVFLPGSNFDFEWFRFDA